MVIVNAVTSVGLVRSTIRNLRSQSLLIVTFRLHCEPRIVTRCVGNRTAGLAEHCPRGAVCQGWPALCG